MKHILIITGCLLAFAVNELPAGEKYFGMYGVGNGYKNRRIGKPAQSIVRYVFHNSTGSPVDSLYAEFDFESSPWNVDRLPLVSSDGRRIWAGGGEVSLGDSFTIDLLLNKYNPHTKAREWQWFFRGSAVGELQRNLSQKSDSILLGQPYGGDVLDYLYKKVIHRPQGLVCGIENAPTGKWVRYTRADKKFFWHQGPPRCLDLLRTSSTGQRVITKEVRNPHVKKHDNALLMDLHLLKLSILANDSGVVEPIEPSATRFGDLLYDDATKAAYPFNGMTIRQIANLADSALSYCGRFTQGFYDSLHTCIMNINLDFTAAEFEVVSFSPFLIKGRVDLDFRPYLHSNPSAIPTSIKRHDGSILDQTPATHVLYQNYPNPFNPTTTIEFALAQDAIVTLKIYNTLGQEVAELIRNELIDEGDQEVEFDASALSSGVYYYKITAQDLEISHSLFTSVKKMTLIR